MASYPEDPSRESRSRLDKYLDTVDRLATEEESDLFQDDAALDGYGPVVLRNGRRQHPDDEEYGDDD